LGKHLWDMQLPHLLVTVLNVVNFMVKVVILCWVNLMIRWSLPRFRYDQIMKLCWRYMLPLSLANVFITGMWILLAPNLFGP
jgi:NADH-quinone oxidoreductase subunit H